jgi:primosomal protein N'
MRQYYPSDMEMPKVGDVVVLKNREGEQSQGIVTGLYPSSRLAIIQEIVDTGNRVYRKGVSGEWDLE